MLRHCAIIWSALVMLAMAAIAAEPNFPALTTGPLVDAAHILSEAYAGQIGASLRGYEISSGHQIAVATVPSLEGNDIRDYGVRLFRKWALGDKQRNDGVLLLVAPNEHKVSIEVGYGLEGDLTDAVSRVIIENAIKPKFKAGDYAGGISAGIADITKVVGGQGDAIIAASKAPPAGTMPGDIIPPLIFFIIMAFILYRASHGRGVIFVPTGGWSRGGWSSGGGFSGGGGGWSGGGGSSGGGGASGSW